MDLRSGHLFQTLEERLSSLCLWVHLERRQYPRENQTRLYNTPTTICIRAPKNSRWGIRWSEHNNHTSANSSKRMFVFWSDAHGIFARPYRHFNLWTSRRKQVCYYFISSSNILQMGCAHITWGFVLEYKGSRRLFHQPQTWISSHCTSQFRDLPSTVPCRKESEDPGCLWYHQRDPKGPVWKDSWRWRFNIRCTWQRQYDFTRKDIFPAFPVRTTIWWKKVALSLWTCTNYNNYR